MMIYVYDDCVFFAMEVATVEVPIVLWPQQSRRGRDVKVNDYFWFWFNRTITNGQSHTFYLYFSTTDQPQTVPTCTQPPQDVLIGTEKNFTATMRGRGELDGAGLDDAGAWALLRLQDDLVCGGEAHAVGEKERRDE